MCALLLIRGASESATVNAVMVLIKLGVLVLFIVVGCSAGTADNFANFAPFGIAGITGAAGIIFFAYIGLDAVSTAGEEVKNPRRTMPLAILIALALVTTVYVAGGRGRGRRPSRPRSSRARRPVCRPSWRRSPAPPGRAR